MTDNTTHDPFEELASELTESQSPEPEIPKEATEDTSSTSDTEPTESKQTKKRRLIIGLSSAAAVVLVAVVVGSLTLSQQASTMTIDDQATPLSSAPSRNSSDSRTSSSSARTATNDDADETSEEANDESTTATEGSSASVPSDSPAASPGSSTPSSPGSGATGGSAGGGTNTGDTSTGGVTTPEKVWVPGWEEQVWVDTSGYQSVHVGDNPIMEYHDVCHTCGAYIDIVGLDHILYGTCTGYSGAYIQVGTTPVYQDQWVQSGYYETIYHEGYWK